MAPYSLPLKILAVALLAGGLEAVPSAAAQPLSTQWTRQFGSPGHTVPTGVAVDAAGAVYLGGWTADALPGQTTADAGRDAWIRKYSPEGTEAWTHQFGTSRADTVMDLAVSRSGVLAVAGQIGGALPRQSSAGAFDAFLRTYDTTGVELWTRQFGGTRGSVGAAAASSLVIDDVGNVYVGGWVNGSLPAQTPVGEDDAFVRKYSANGALLWTRQFGSTGHDFVTDLSLSASGGVYVAGQMDESADQNGLTFVRNFGPDGDEISTRRYARSDTVAHIAVTPAGEVYVVGESRQPHVHAPDRPDNNHHGVAVLRKFASDGMEMWVRQFGLPGDDLVTGLAVDAYGNAFVTGRTTGLVGGSADAVLRQYDAAGNLQRNTRFGSTALDVASAVAIGESRAMYVAGWTSGALPDQTLPGLSGAFIKKLLL